MNSSASDDILRRARRREPAALDQIVREYGHRVFGLLYRMTNSRDVAEELTQETFLRVVRTIDTYAHDGKFDAWLFRIASNLARDRVRQRKRRGVSVGIDSVAEESAVPSDSSTADPAERLILAEDTQRLEIAMGELNDQEREILALRHYSEMSFREIADLLGIPLGTALARAYRALQHLKASLKTDATA